MPLYRTKSDNKSLFEKLEIRKRICAEIREPLRVLDLFCGQGRVWKAMAKHFPIATYTPVDKAVKQEGAIRMNVTPRSVQAFNPAEFNCIDIDTYGDPWEIWEVISRRVQTRTAIFLTFGHMGMGGLDKSHNPNGVVKGLSKFLRTQEGIPLDWPAPLSGDLLVLLGRRYFLRSMAAVGAETALLIDHPNVSYYGALVTGKGKIA
jgi:hypothetical protein